MKPRQMQMGFSGSQRFETFSYLLCFIHLFAYFNFSPSSLSELCPGTPRVGGCFPRGMDESRRETVALGLDRERAGDRAPLFGLPSFPGVFSV